MIRKMRRWDRSNKPAGALLPGGRVPSSSASSDDGGNVSCLGAHDGTLGLDGVNVADVPITIPGVGVSTLSLPSRLLFLRYRSRRPTRAKVGDSDHCCIGVVLGSCFDKRRSSRDTLSSSLPGNKVIQSV